MRKQTKLVAVLSTAALLAVGASMTSFAATGWQEENGTWVYYDRSGDLVTDQWEKSGDHWFYLNDDGEMTTDEVFEYDDDYYYVDENGSMVTNQWVSVENEDYDGDDDEEPVNHWYYFGSNGRAYKSSTNSSNASFKTINGKKYIFDEDGLMLYGWVNDDGERETGDDAWREGIYYCGEEDDGAQRAGDWEYLEITDNNYDDQSVGYSSDNLFDDEEQTRYFYFKTNGKKMVDEDGKTINGKKYGFDEYGRMNAEWVNWDSTPTEATMDSASRSDYTSEFRYYGSPEDGARVTKGWFQVVPDSYLNLDDYDDDEENWYYADKDGQLYASELKKIDGKKYAFDEYGVMQTGLVAILFDGDSTSDILKIQEDDDMDDCKFDTEDDFKENISDLYTNRGYKIFYFGDDNDGKMVTGKQNIDIDGDSFKFLFNKSGSYKGAGKFGIDDKKYYAGGMLMAADSDDKYSVVKAVMDNEGNYTEIRLLDTDEFLSEVGVGNNVPDGEEEDYDEYYDVADEAADYTDGDGNTTMYRVVNTSGTVQKSKSKCKDGDDRCYEVDSNKCIERVFVED